MGRVDSKRRAVSLVRSGVVAIAAISARDGGWPATYPWAIRIALCFHLGEY